MSSDTDDKECTGCRESKPLDAFPMRAVRGVKRRSPRCADCLREESRKRQQRHRERDPERAREVAREGMRRGSARRLGLSEEIAEELRAGRCGICGETPPEGCQLYQDKSTGAVPGALCLTCSRGLAMLGATPERLTAALAFVQSGADYRDKTADQAR
jgi:hypothetical protein